MFASIIYFITYQLLQIIVLPGIIFYITIRKIRGKSAFGSFRERLGLIPKVQKNKQRPIIWIHAVSVGEILSIASLIEKIKQSNKQAICYVTTGTPAGKKIAKEKLAADYISFLPYDFLISMLFAFTRIKPTSIIIVEAEFWPNFLLLSHLKNVPLYLLNARMNKKSQKHYEHFRLFIKPLLNLFNKIYAQSAYDKAQLIHIGAIDKNITVLGNVKAQNVLAQWKPAIKTKITNIHPTLLVGSLHPGELTVYLTLFEQVKKIYSHARLILAPRHFHWQKNLVEQVSQMSYTYTVWDTINQADVNTFGDILLVCKLGELFNLYQYADIFYLGGTFVPIGGHNLLEPAVWERPTIIGPYDSNCHVIAHELQQNNALIQVRNTQQVIDATKEILANQDKKKSMGEKAKEWLLEQATSTEKHMNDLIKKVNTFF